MLQALRPKIAVLLLGLAACPGAAATEAAPQRIVSLLPSLTEILFAVGAGDRVVGVTTHCSFPPEAQGRTVVGGYVRESMSLELIVGLEPDLVLAFDDDAQTAVIAELRRFGLPVEAIAVSSVQEVAAAIRRIGELVGRNEAADEVAQEVLASIEQIHRRIDEIPTEKRPRVFYAIWHEPLMTAGRRTFIHELIELAGGKNVFGDVDREYFQVSLEEMLARDPQVILGADSHGLIPSLVDGSQPGWSQVAAIRQGRAFGIDGDIVSRPGPRLGEALRLIADRLHPGLFSPSSADRFRPLPSSDP